MNRVLRVARMQLINKQTFIWVPLMIIGGAFVISYLIFAILRANGIVPANESEQGFNGASQAPLWYFFAIGIQSLTHSFPFSQAMSVTRRTFFLGTALVTAGASAALATLYTLLAPIERATDGWGVGSNMFTLPWVTDGAWYQGWVFYFALAMLFFVLGFWFATIYKRWGSLVLTVAITAISLAILGIVALISWRQWWPNVGLWFTEQNSLSVGAWILVVAVVLGASSYLTLRRTVP